MELNSTNIQTTLLRLLVNSRTDSRIGRGQHYLAEELRAQFSPHHQPTVQQILAAMWALVSQGLAYIDITQSSPDNWELCLTEIGLAAARDEEINPDNAGEYLRRLEAKVPDASPTVVQYAREAVVSYTSKSYLASAVMLGVASEAAFLETAKAFGSWLGDGQKEKFLDLVNSPKTNYIAKFVEFRKRIEPIRTQLPGEIADGMSLTLDSVLDLLRTYRNDAGHPTGKRISRDDAFINLQMFVRYLQKLYAMKSFLEEEGTNLRNT